MHIGAGLLFNEFYTEAADDTEEKMTDYLKLKSGTDVRGVAVKCDEREVMLTDNVCSDIASGYALWLAKKTGKNIYQLTVAVGHDCRISGKRIKDAVIKGLTRCGCRVLDCGLSSTPAMFMITVNHDVDGAVQITASHHPYELNGLKFFAKDGGLQGGDITEILTYCQNGELPKEQDCAGDVSEFNYMPEYCAMLRRQICEGIGAENESEALKGFHIVVDAGNGVGGFYAEKVLKELGADITGSVYLEPDGMFPNHIPNPENKDAMRSIQRATVDSKADIGLIFDTDVDRAGCVDGNGNEINRNRLIALAAVMALEKYPGGTVVTDSVTSTGLKKFIEAHGGKHYRYKRGYRNVINKAEELTRNGENAPLAIETSGHAAFKDNYFLDDGAYLMTRTVILLARLKKDGKTIEDLIGTLEEPKEEKELRLGISAADFRKYGAEVIQRLEKCAESREGWSIADDNREGVRIYCDKGYGDGWFLLRLSVHDPVMPLNAESNTEGGCKKMISQLYDFLKKQDGLVLDSIKNYLCKEKTDA